MVRYMSILGSKKFDTEIRNHLEDAVWLVEETPLSVPYIKLKIKIIGRETRFGTSRKPIKRRFIFFGKKKGE